MAYQTHQTQESCHYCILTLIKLGDSMLVTTNIVFDDGNCGEAKRKRVESRVSACLIVFRSNKFMCIRMKTFFFHKNKSGTGRPTEQSKWENQNQTRFWGNLILLFLIFINIGHWSCKTLVIASPWLRGRQTNIANTITIFIHDFIKFSLIRVSICILLVHLCKYVYLSIA